MFHVQGFVDALESMQLKKLIFWRLYKVNIGCIARNSKISETRRMWPPYSLGLNRVFAPSLCRDKI